MQILKQILLEEYMKRKMQPYKIVMEILLIATMIYGVFGIQLLYLGAYMSLGLLFAYLWFATFQSEKKGMAEISCLVPRTGKGFLDYVVCRSNLAATLLAGTVCLVLGITYYMVEELIWNVDTISLILYISIGIFTMAKERIAAGMNAGYRKQTVSAYRKHTAVRTNEILRFVQLMWTGITVVAAWISLSSYEVEMLEYGETLQIDIRWKMILYGAMVAELVIAGVLSHFQYTVAELGDYDSRISENELGYE